MDDYFDKMATEQSVSFQTGKGVAIEGKRDKIDAYYGQTKKVLENIEKELGDEVTNIEGHTGKITTAYRNFRTAVNNELKGLEADSAAILNNYLVTITPKNPGSEVSDDIKNKAQALYDLAFNRLKKRVEEAVDFDDDIKGKVGDLATKIANLLTKIDSSFTTYISVLKSKEVVSGGLEAGFLFGQAVDIVQSDLNRGKNK